MAEQRIVKMTRKVLITLLDGRQLSGEVFLGLYEAHHSGHQKVGELLNGADDFIPFKTSDAVFLLNIAQILMVETSKEEELDELMTLGKQYPVQVSLLHSKELTGEAYVDLPDETCRVRDWLNQPIAFLRLFLPDQIIYVNRRYVISVQD